MRYTRPSNHPKTYEVRKKDYMIRNGGRGVEGTDRLRINKKLRVEFIVKETLGEGLGDPDPITGTITGVV